MNDEITLDYLLSSKNVNGEIYRCDIKRFFGWQLNDKKVEKLHKALTEMRNKNV